MLKEPKSYIAKTVEEADGLPLVIVLEKEDNVVLYKIPNESIQDFFKSSGRINTSFDSIKKASEKFGEKITLKTFFEETEVLQPTTAGPFPGNRQYSIYRTRFKEENNS